MWREEVRRECRLEHDEFGLKAERFVRREHPVAVDDELDDGVGGGVEDALVKEGRTGGGVVGGRGA
jgi:hypothetical protein